MQINRKIAIYILGLVVSLSCLSTSTLAGETCNAIEFDSAPDYRTGTNVVASSTGDFNGDGTTDIAVVSGNLGFSVILGDGSGGYGPPKHYPVEVTEYNTWDLTAADLNGDGKSDLVIGALSNLLVIYMNDGVGGFGPPTRYIPPTEFPGSGSFQQMASGDFNGDGKIDIAYTQYQSARKLRFLMGDGTGNLALTASIDLVGNESSITVGDLDGNSMTDVLVAGAHGNGLRYIGYVLGTTGTPAIAVFRSGMSDFPAYFTIGDFNNDGVNDFVLAGGGSGTSFLRPYINVSGAYVEGAKIDLTYLLTPSGITSSDYNGDGKRDIAVMIGNGLVVTEDGVGNGTFQNERLWTVPQGDAIYTVDADRNNRPDLISVQHRFTSNNLITVMESKTAGGFAAPEPIFYGENYLTSGDLDNDGLIDIITAPGDQLNGSTYIAWALNNGARSFLPAETVDNGPSNLKGLKTGHFDGDGILDVVSVHGSNNRLIEVYLGDGRNRLRTGIPTALNVIWNDVVVSDFNNDGRDDLFAISNSGQAYSLLNDGSGTFTLAPNFPIATLGNGTRLKMGDFNGDGKMDIVVNNGLTSIYAGSGGGQFTLLAENVITMQQATVADLNGDGKLDLAGLATGGMTGILGDGAGGFGTPFSLAVTGSEIRNMAAGDFNLDGSDDIAYVFGPSEGPGLAIIPSAAAGATPAWGTPVISPLRPSNITVADFDNDGKDDIGFSNLMSRGVLHNTSGTKPCISINDVSVTEGDSGQANATVAINLSAPASDTVRVNYTLEMLTATLNADVQPVSGRLEIPAGTTTANIVIPIQGDLLDEFDETFRVNLTGADNAFLPDTSALITILDNDAEPTLTVTDVTRAENGAGSFVFTVNLSAPSGKTIGFRYATADGTATGGNLISNDYSSVDSVVSISPGTTSSIVGIGINFDNTYELDETLLLNITTPTNVTIADGQGVGTLVNDDPVPTIVIFGGGFTQEGDTGTTTSQQQVNISNPSYLPITINYSSANGTAVAGADYVALNGSVTIPAEQMSQIPALIDVQALGDTINEPNETFTLNLSVTNVVSQPAPITYTIVDDERISNDYDLDGKTDLAVFRPSTGIWYTLLSSNGTFTAIQHGLATDKVVAGDYTGDGRFDIAVWRPETGTWFPRGTPNRTQNWGMSGDIPVPGDYDNDNRIDLAVFRPSDQFWYIQLSSNNSLVFTRFGLSEDKPVQADYDGDGKTDIAVYRPSTGTWYISRSSDGAVTGGNWGLAADVPVPADYDGDGKADIAVFRDGNWYVNRSSDNGVTIFQWGQAGDKPVPGNYDGDAKTDFAVYRAGMWWIFRSATQDFIAPSFGLSDDIPVPSVSY